MKFNVQRKSIFPKLEYPVKEESFLVVLIPCSLEIRGSLEISSLFPHRRRNFVACPPCSIWNLSHHPFSTHPNDDVILKDFLFVLPASLLHMWRAACPQVTYSLSCVSHTRVLDEWNAIAMSFHFFTIPSVLESHWNLDLSFCIFFLQ